MLISLVTDRCPFGYLLYLQGSGRAADILAHAYIFAKEEEIEAQDSEGKKQKK